ncbi:hypothetical protein MCANUF31_02875 [Mycoplasmopsis canis UF31]|uniref:hypothetical protein n=1 Tax=Mycoplasmopsis canis TaxID=29555 RepID=UPI00025AEFFF|nr:hypothetical protein [Mycoplasmopsis canis]EIE39610.1 hypothetical protein MCANUF31_02875 [Mycoplasmopsis canis UF31]
MGSVGSFSFLIASSKIGSSNLFLSKCGLRSTLASSLVNDSIEGNFLASSFSFLTGLSVSLSAGAGFNGLAGSFAWSFGFSSFLVSGFLI